MRQKRFDVSKAFNPSRADNQAAGANSVLEELLAGTPTTAEARAAGIAVVPLAVTIVAPDYAQLRRLPHPNVLAERANNGDTRAAQLLEGLRELGQSMRQEGQIQPIQVYPFADAAEPDVRYRIWIGQRRWSAALLEGLPTIDAVVVELPSDVRRLQRQFTENERRADFNDMERAWAIGQIRQAMSAEAGSQEPWSVVEQQLGISESLRKQQMRLLRFDREGQELLAYYGWSEPMVRPIHSAIQSGTLSQAEATELLRQLAREPEANGATVETLLAALVPPEVVFPAANIEQTATSHNGGSHDNISESGTSSRSRSGGSTGSNSGVDIEREAMPGMPTSNDALVDGYQSLLDIAGVLQALRGEVPASDEERAQWLNVLGDIQEQLDALAEALRG